MTDRFIDWLDAATVLEADKPTYSVLVGTTGGSDGNAGMLTIYRTDQLLNFGSWCGLRIGVV